MAKYDRRMLIPYLRDLYCTELLLMQKKEQRLHILETQNRLTEKFDNDTQMEAPREPSTDNMLILCLFSAIICGVVVLSAVFFGSRDGMIGQFLLGCLMIAILGAVILIKVRKRKEKQQEYQKWQKKHQEDQDKLRRKIEHYDRRLEELNEMCNELHAIRHSLYSVNIIPAHYRTVQVVQYLLEYFKTTKANNPDIVLQTFAIEEIRKPHMEIEKKLAEVTLHQRMLLATHIMADEEQSEYVQAQLRTIAEQEKNPDLKAQYQKIALENWNLSDYLIKYEQH